MRDWSEARVSDLASQERNALVGGPFGSNLVSRDYVDDGIPVIRGQNMVGRWIGGEFAFVTPEKAEALSANIARPGDVIFTQRGTLGQVAIVPEKPYDRYLVSQSQMKLTVDKKKADPVFYYYVFKSPQQYNYILQNAIQTGVPHTNLSILKSTPIPLPALDEQRAIASVLGVLDDKIELNRRMNETLEAMARTIFKSWFIDFDPVRAKAEGRKAKLSLEIWEQFPSSFDEDELPEGWGKRPAYEIAEFVNGAAYRNMHFSPSPEGLPVIKIVELKNGITSSTNFTTTDLGDNYRIDTGEILFSWSGNPDTSIDTFVWVGGPAWLNQHIFRVRENGHASRAMIYFQLKQLKPVFTEMARNKQTTGLGHVTARDMKDLMVCDPPEPIANAFDTVAGSIFQRIVSNLIENQTLSRIRNLLLPKLISGEIRVRDAESVVKATPS